MEYASYSNSAISTPTSATKEAAVRRHFLSEEGAAGPQATFAVAAGTRPASTEGKLELTKAPRSTIAAAGIPEGFRSGLPWMGCRERRGSEGSCRTGLFRQPSCLEV